MFQIIKFVIFIKDKAFLACSATADHNKAREAVPGIMICNKDHQKINLTGGI